MKTKNFLLFVAALSSLLTTAEPLFAQGTAFTYQGRLFDAGNPANGNYDMQFYLRDALNGGNPVDGTNTVAPVAVSNGLFTVKLDFGAGVFTGPQRWLVIGVRTNGSVSAYTALAPRQELTPVPYAITAENVDGSVPAGQLTGTLPAGVLSGTYGNALNLNNAGNTLAGNGSGLTSLNASQLTTGTVPDARLSGNVAFLDHNQTFTGANIFDRGSGGPGRLIVNGSTPVDTTSFTGLGLQYYASSGEGAILASYTNGGFDGFGSLSFYTKGGSGHPLTKAMAIDYYGNVAVDQGNYNAGFLNNNQTNGAGLTFGTGSGEGIASKRTAGGNLYGLDFYTGFVNRMSIANNGNILIKDPAQTIVFPATGGANSPMMAMFASGTGNADRMVIAHSLTYPNYGLQYQDSVDRFNFLGNGTPMVTVNLGSSYTPLVVNGEFAVVNGYGNEQAYLGGDGAGGDVQVGSLTSGITAVAFYNATDNAYMHIYCSSITIEGGADLAEPFKIASGNNEVPQGAVVVIDEKNPGQLKMSDQPYDTHVAGVVSGANGINPGIQMQQQGLLDGGKNVALTGRVYVHADTTNGSIKPGDLLTTSVIPGYAMKVTDHAKAQGAILGKAMTGLSEGQGMVLVLVTLQ